MKFYLSNKKITKITQMKLYWFIEKILYLKKEKEKLVVKNNNLLKKKLMKLNFHFNNQLLFYLYILLIYNYYMY